jgi:FdhD protein
MHPTLAILAGGASSRMGSPKSHLTFQNKPILKHLLDELSWPGPTLLITAPEREHPPAHHLFNRELIDPFPNMGPLGAFLTALENASTDWTVFLPVDMPLVRREHLQFILDNRQSPGTFLLRSGSIEPFPCILHRDSIETIRAHFDSPDQSLKSLAREPQFHNIAAPVYWDASIWTNLNYPEDLKSISTHRPITRYRDNSFQSATDDVAEESPLEIRVRNRALSVTMRTPGHDPELAVGFLLGEGLIHSRNDILSIDPCSQSREGNILNINLHANAKVDFAKLTRHTYASSSCGLCGKASIDSIHQHFDPITTSQPRVPAEVILPLPDKLRAAQPTFTRTGGLHAAALFDLSGGLLLSREDVGRHNAVDKVLGHALLNNWIPLDRHILLVSGRASFEIMQKSLAAQIPIVCAVSAPSTLAVDFASESNQTLIGFLRDRRMNIYSCPERITG